MKLRRTLLASLAAAVIVLEAKSAQAQARAKVQRTASKSATAASFSVEVPLVQRSAPPNGGQSGTLVLNSAHSFNITLLATNQHNGNVQGAGVALPQTDTFGYFSLPSITNNPSNPEVFVKILDARTVNSFFWVFFGGLTDLQYTLTVTEVATGRVKQYTNPPGSFSGGADTSAFTGSAAVSSNLEDVKAATVTVAPNAFVRTAIDISNNTNSTVSANLQYAYTCTAPTCSPVNQFARTNANAASATIPILGLGSLHFDDIVQYFRDQGLLTPGADLGSTGSLLVIFNNVPSNIGWEATVQARTYNRVSEVDPLRGSVGFGENASLFFDSTNTTLVGTAIDTRTLSACTGTSVFPSCSLEGSLTTHVGIVNTDIHETGDTNPATVDLLLYDPGTGHQVGSTLTLTNIRPGEVRLVKDLFTVAGVPATIHSVLVFADVHNSSSAPTIEGFLLTQETNSGDTRFNELKCADPAGLCGF